MRAADAVVHGYWEMRWNGPVSLTHPQSIALAGKLYRAVSEHLRTALRPTLVDPASGERHSAATRRAVAPEVWDWLYGDLKGSRKEAVNLLAHCEPVADDELEWVFGSVADPMVRRGVRLVMGDDLHASAEYRRDNDGVSPHAINKNDLMAARPSAQKRDRCHSKRVRLAGNAIAVPVETLPIPLITAVKRGDAYGASRCAISNVAQLKHRLIGCHRLECQTQR
jgi:hypothetical protein